MKNKSLKLGLFLMLSLFYSAAFAQVGSSKISVEGRFFDPAGKCDGYPGNETENYEFQVTYENQNLPWGSSVAVLYGFRSESYIGDGFGTIVTDWVSPGQSEAIATAPYVWTAKVNQTQPHNLNPSLSQFQYVVKVTLPDGQVFYENNGAAYSHLTAEMPQFVCAENPPMQKL